MRQPLAALTICALTICAVTVRSATRALANDTGFATTTHDTRREGGRLCVLGHTHGGSGDGGTKSVALIAALKVYVDTTTDEYGSDWASWSKAGSKRVSYTKTADGWTAAVEGRPCR